MHCHIWWSIYVRAGKIQRLKERHLPAIDAALGPAEFEWDVTREDSCPELLRLVNYQNISGDTVEALILQVLRKLGRIAEGFSISGLGDLDAPTFRHMSGTWRSSKPAHRAPALEDIAFEVLPGRIAGMTNDGGWYQEPTYVTELRDFFERVNERGNMPWHRPELHREVLTALQRFQQDSFALESENAIVDRTKQLFGDLDLINEKADGALLETDQREIITSGVLGALKAQGIDLSKFEDGDPTMAYRKL